MALWRECRLVTIHGAAVGKEATASVRQLLMDDTPVTFSGLFAGGSYANLAIEHFWAFFDGLGGPRSM